MKQLPQGQYDFKKTEEKILRFWQSRPFFKPEYNPTTDSVQSIEEFKEDPREKWTLICPPPNAYDRPHMGNLSGYAYMDAMARYNRLRGKRVIMLPGKDHAGLEGEATFIRDVLEKEGKKKSDFTREEFYQRVWDHQQKFIKLIRDDEKIMGLSADFDRDLYTLDERVVSTILGTFVDMYQKGLLYRGVRVVNWDVKAQSTIPDNQCVREKREGKLYFIRYPLSQYANVPVKQLKEEQYLIVATTRPETMFGDTAIVVHPNDERYMHLVGKKVIIPFVNREVPIITSRRVEKDFGTGVLKCTPAHSHEDWEIMQEWNAMNSYDIKTRLNSEKTGSQPNIIKGHEVVDTGLNERIGYINVIDKNLQMVGPVPEKYRGMYVNDAREAIIKDLNDAGFIVKEEIVVQNVLVSERTGVIIEPLVTSQWFMNVDSFKQPLKDMVINGDTKIYPKNLEKVYFSWLDNMRDWAISRSLWWGYRLPVWYSSKVREEIDSDGQVRLKIKNKKLQIEEDFDPSNPEHMRVQIKCPGKDWIQDDDILDTWFSSGQWPYVHLGVSGFMDVAYPTDVLVSATDLLVKWDLTMMLFSHYKTGKPPFKNLFLTGLVKGTDGQKMSKSKRNFIPLDETRENYGVDSFRMNCFYQNKAGRAYSITSESLRKFRNFNNKLWNASKFVIMNLEGLEESYLFDELNSFNNAKQLVDALKNDKWNLKKGFEIKDGDDFPLLDDINCATEMAKLEEKYHDLFEKYRFGLITEILYDSFWHYFCDIYIEKSKSRVWKYKETGQYKQTLESRLAAQATLYYALKSYLLMLHPFIPFITEEIWQHLVEDGKYQKPMMYSQWFIGQNKVTQLI